MTPTQLKAWNKNRAKKDNLSIRAVERNFMLEKFLEKITVSDYQDNFILKGGFLIGSKIGLSQRTTEDLDTTLRRMEVSRLTVEKMMYEIIRTPTKEGIQFNLTSITEIREENDYPGYRIKLTGNLENYRVPIKLDITTGDSIVPKEERYSHKLMYEEKYIAVYAYPIEQILAEKLETILSRGETNTRARDFYDVYSLKHLESESIDYHKLSKSLHNTMMNRRTTIDQSEYKNRIKKLSESSLLLSVWKSYAKNHPYAEDLAFKEVLSTIEDLIQEISQLNE